MTITRLDDHQDQAGAWDVLAAQHGHLAFNIGANIGQAAKVLAPNFGTVVALEPCKESFDILLVESAPNVVPIMAAVSSQTGSVELTESAYSISTGQLTTGPGLSWGATLGTRSVDSVTVDDLIAHYGEPDFVNVDTEGHEVAVLEGWSEPHCEVLIEVHAAKNERLVRDLWGGPLRKLEHNPRVGRTAYVNHFWLTSVGA